MRFVSVRIITDDIKSLIQFYEAAFCIKANWLNEEFAEIRSGSMTLAIGSTKTLALFGGQIATPKTNKAAILEFIVPDVDEDFKRISALKAEIVQGPTTMPWGNRSLLFRDLDGNLINFFTPVTSAAIERFKAEL